MFRKVLVAVMGAATEDLALDAAGDLATRMGSEVVLAGIIATEDGPSPRPDAMEAERRDAARTFLHRALERMREHGVVPSAVEITGPPVDSVLDYARQQGADLIVVPVGGEPPAALIPKDFPTLLVERARCSVLAVPRSAQ